MNKQALVEKIEEIVFNIVVQACNDEKTSVSKMLLSIFLGIVFEILVWRRYVLFLCLSVY